MTANKIAVTALACVVLSGCKLEIIVPEGGRVTSTGGAFDCARGSTCRWDIDDKNFNQTFTAVPDAGFVFTGWSGGDSHLCIGSDGSCVASLLQLPATLRESALASDSVARLEPIFERTGGAASQYDLGGTIGVLTGSILDSDTNNPDDPSRENNSVATAQTAPNPATIGGYVNVAGAGAGGDSFAAGDRDDFFKVTASAGQIATLHAADYTNSDLDLYLYNTAGEIADLSTGTGEVEQITIPSDGTWYLNPFAFSGASNYTLTLGTGSSIQSRGEVVPGEVLVKYAAESVLQTSSSASQQRRVQHKLALTELGGGLGRTRRLKAQDATMSQVTASTRTGSSNQYSADKASHFGQNNALKAQWETWMLVKATAAEQGVAHAAPNYRVQAKATTNDSLMNLAWHYPLISLGSAWDITTGDPGVVVAVVDSGIITQHPDMQGQLVAGYDFVSDASGSGDGDGIDANPTDEGEGSNPYRSGNFHGLHVAGTIAAAGNNNTGIAGVAYGSKIMPLRALNADGGGSGYDVIQAMRFAGGLSNDSGTVPAKPADVMNLSLGGGGFNPAEQELFRTLTNNGMLIAAASGNSGATTVEYPGAYDNVFAVGATGAQRDVTEYSTGGTALDLVAPGGRMEADVTADGKPDGVLSTYYTDGEASYQYLEGTSMATPHVAGVFALMRSVNPNLTSANVEALLQSGALTEDVGPTGRDNRNGWGFINARKAVRAAQELAGGTTTLPPQLSISTQALNFGNSLTSASIILSNIGDGTLTVNTPQSNASWLTVAPTSVDANGVGTYGVQVNRAALTAGSYQSSLQFTSSAGSATVAVSVQVGSTDAGDVGSVYVLFIDVTTQREVAQAVTTKAANYQYSLTGLPQGRYEIWAGTDTDNDLLICDEGETCGAYPSIDSPLIIDVTADNNGLDFSSLYQIRLPSSSSVTGSDKPLARKGYRRLK